MAQKVTKPPDENRGMQEAVEDTKREVIHAAIRVVDEVWREEIERDGTVMVLVPKALFERLEKAVRYLRKW